MKIYNKEHPKLIKLDISQRGLERKNLTLCDTTFEDAFKFVETIVSKHGSSIKKGNNTTIRVKEYIGGKITPGNDKCITFYGLVPEDIHDILLTTIQE